MRKYKVDCKRADKGFVFIECPKCKTEQQVIISDEWYSIDLQGHVDPVFVCMRFDRSCDFMGHIWIVNFN